MMRRICFRNRAQRSYTTTSLKAAFWLRVTVGFGRIFKNRIVAKRQKHFLWPKRPLSAILKSRTTNEVIRPKHSDQVSTKIILEQKA